MRLPSNVHEVLRILEQHRIWVESGGKADVPEFFAVTDPPSLFRLLGGGAIHGPAAILRWVCRKLGLWRLVAVFARFRLDTPDWGFESGSCERNNALTLLGRAHLKLGDTTSAIACLEQAALVYPCPHNTSFGLNQSLCRALEGHSEAQEAVTQCRRLSKEFIR